MSDTYTFTQVTRVTPKGGSVVGLQPVTITGFGFDFATGGVTFGGIAATAIFIDSNTSIRCTTPAHASGAVDVVVAGVGTGSSLYSYQNPSLIQLPRVPVSDGTLELDKVDAVKWLMEVKKRLESIPVIEASSIVAGAALSRVNDVNVTLTLTGTPETALLQAVTMTLGWSGALTPARGGTGLQGFVTGDLLYASSAVVLSRLADVSVGSYLRSGGVATAPLWSTLKLPNAANSGDILKASSANTYASVAPQALSKVDDTNVTLTLGGTPLTALVNAASLTLGWTGTLAVSRGGTNIASYAIGDLLYASGATTLSKLADVAAGSYLRSGGVTTAPVWSTLTLPNSAATGDLLYASGANAMALRTIGSTGDVLSVSGGVPTWSAAAAVATAVTITNDTTTNSTMFPTWVTANTGNLPIKVTSTKLTFNPSTGTLSSTLFVAATSVSTPSLIGTGAIGVTPASGSNLNVTLATTGDLVVNSTQLYVDTSAAKVGIGTAAPSAPLTVKGATATNVNAFAVIDSADVQRFAVQDNGSCLFSGSATDTGPLYTSGNTINGQFNVNANGTLHLNLTGYLAGVTQFRTTQISDGKGAGILYVIGSTGRTGFGVASPNAVIHLKAGTTVANTAPLKFNTGSLLATAEAGAVEFLADDYYATITTGAARKGIVLNDGTALTATRVPFATTNGRLTDDSDMTFATDTLTVTKLSAPTSVSTGTLAQTGKTTTYNNVATAGWGQPAVYGSGRSTAQVAAVASVATYTVGAADGSFLVSANVNVTTSTVHNFAVQVDYTDETNAAQTLTLTMSQITAAFVSAITNVTGAGPYEGVQLHIRCKASTAITVKTAGTFTTVTYNVEAAIQQIA